jgi:hypothetical protein
MEISCSMANCRIPGPQGHHLTLADTATSSSGDDIGCQGGHLPGPAGSSYHRPIVVADAGKDKSKKPPAKTPDKPTPADTIKINSIIFHLYLPITVKGDKPGSKNFSATDFFNWIRGKQDDAPDDGKVHEWQPDHWENLGISLELNTKVATGVDDFKKSLQRKGAIVVYLGHSTLDQYHGNRSMGLTPQGHAKPEIPSDDLRALLKKSAASMVIIASCDSMTSVGPMTSGPATIVTDSGSDRMTNTIEWANALGAFFFLLIGLELDGGRQPSIARKAGHATIGEALDASATAFDKAGTKDRFKLVHGDSSIKLIP